VAGVIGRRFSTTRQVAKFFDRERRRHIGEDAKLLLLKTDGALAPFAVVVQVDSAWNTEFSDFFGSTTFNVARNDAEFAAQVGEASYAMVVDSDKEALNNQLFAINRETTRLAGVDPYCRIRATETGKRYLPA
jgi:hypothetical protein